MASSALDLLNLEYDKVTFMDIAEEDSEKELENGLDEDMKILQSFSKNPCLYLIKINRKFNFYPGNSSVRASSVFLPPPEFNA